VLREANAPLHPRRPPDSRYPDRDLLAPAAGCKRLLSGSFATASPQSYPEGDQPCRPENVHTIIFIRVAEIRFWEVMVAEPQVLRLSQQASKELGLPIRVVLSTTAHIGGKHESVNAELLGPELYAVRTVFALLS
jgi:hypothetical protein